MFRSITFTIGLFAFSSTAFATDTVDLPASALEVASVEMDIVDIISAMPAKEASPEPATNLIDEDDELTIGASFLGNAPVETAPATATEIHTAIEIAAVPEAQEVQEMKWNFNMDDDGDLNFNEEEEVVEEATPESDTNQDMLLNIIEE